MNTVGIGQPNSQSTRSYGNIIDPILVARLVAPVASIPRRATAYLIDGIVATIGLFVFMLFASLVLDVRAEVSPIAGAIGGLVTVVAGFGLVCGYFIVPEALIGATVGKGAMGLMVIRLDGGAIGWREAVIRNTMRLVDMLPFLYLFGCISMLASEHNRRLGDLVAGTKVVRS